MDWELLVNLHDEVGESPLWSPADQALWRVDIHGQRLHRLDWATRRTRSWATPERIGCIALHGAGGLLAALQSGLFHLQPQDDGRLDAQPLAAFTHARPDMRGNDGRCDRAGRFFTGTMVGDTSRCAGAAEPHWRSAGAPVEPGDAAQGAGRG